VRSHWSVERYRAHVRRQLARVAAAAAAALDVARAKTLLVWVATQATPPATRAAAFRDAAEWRSQARLRAFNTAAAEEVAALAAAVVAARRPLRVAVLDAYSPSLGVATTSADGSHITLPAFQAALRDAFFEIVCPWTKGLQPLVAPTASSPVPRQRKSRGASKQ